MNFGLSIWIQLRIEQNQMVQILWTVDDFRYSQEINWHLSSSSTSSASVLIVVKASYTKN